MKEYVLLIACPDQIGIINKTTSVLLKSEFNIIENKEYVDKESKTFFMRTLVVGDGIKNNIEKKIQKLKLNEHFLLWKEKKTPNILIMASDEYHCLGDLLVRNQQKDLNANVLSVISQKDTLRQFTEQFNIPFHQISSKEISREEHENKINQVLENYNYDYIVTAKYMRIFTKKFSELHKNKLINIHHSFLPSFKGYDPYEQAFNRGVKIIGATSHFINENLDEGPIISQKILPVNQEWSIDEMKKQGRQAEISALNEALDLVFNDRVFVFKNKTIIL